MRKKITIVALLMAALTSGYLFLLSWAAGFTLCKLCGGKTEGKRGRVKSIIIPWRSYQLHLHHWLLSLLAVALSAIHGFFVGGPELFYGFLSGVVFQGIYCYDDWYRLIKRRDSEPEAVPGISY